MNLAYRLLISLVVVLGLTLLFLGLARALKRLRDDVPRNVARAAAESVRAGPIRTDGGTPRSESVVCSTCGETNRTEATFCRECVGTLRR